MKTQHTSESKEKPNTQLIVIASNLLSAGKCALKELHLHNTTCQHLERAITQAEEILK